MGKEDGQLPDSLLSKVELPQIIDLIVNKQTQYYSLWAVYTAVQFAAGSYGYGHPLSLGLGIAVFIGVWAFNIGHLSFLLRCADQLDNLKDILLAALENDTKKYLDTLRKTFKKISEVGLPENYKGCYTWTYFMNRTTYVHLLIDTCATAALVLRIDNAIQINSVTQLDNTIRIASQWIQSHLILCFLLPHLFFLTFTIYAVKYSKRK